MDSILLQKQVRDNAKDLQEFYKELQVWGDQIKKQEGCKQKEKGEPTPSTSKELDEINKKVSKKSSKSLGNGGLVNKKQKRLYGSDYSAWDKFDADAYCERMDKEENDELSSAESDISIDTDENMLELANTEKIKGNKFVKEKLWQEAIECYTKAIQYYGYDPIYYANRALCYFKKGDYHKTEADSTIALQLDKTYVKAYQRRAAAREKLKQIQEAYNDLLKVLEFEPKNSESIAAIARLEKRPEIKKLQEVKARESCKSMFAKSRPKRMSDVSSPSQTIEDDVMLKKHVIERVNLPTSVQSSVKELPETTHKVRKEPEKENTSSSGVISEKQVNFAEQNLFINGPGGKDIQLIMDIRKAPKTRSKKPLKRIDVVDVNMKTEKEILFNQSNEKRIENDDHLYEILKESMDELKDEIQKVPDGIDVKVDDNKDKIATYKIPNTFIEFHSSWKDLKPEERYLYLQQINPKSLTKIFTSMLETKVFSEILDTLSTFYVRNNDNFYNVLIGLSEVSRFKTLLMFMTKADQANVLKLVEAMKIENKYTKDEIECIKDIYFLN